MFATELEYYDEIGSTNDVARTRAEGGAGEGFLVVADAQSAGRGRYRRSWASPPGAGLYLSMVLRPAPHAVPLLTIAAGVAVAEGVQTATGLMCDLKWPNDVYIGERKLAGVLAEADANHSTGQSTGHHPVPSVSYVVLGIGINVMPAAYPPDVAARATSIEDQLGRPIDRGLLLAECLVSLARRYRDLQTGRDDVVLDAWREHARPTLGRRVCWQSAGLERTGVAMDIDGAGALIIRTADGIERVISGEVAWM